jgi:hypothetical protein
MYGALGTIAAVCGVGCRFTNALSLAHLLQQETDFCGAPTYCPSGEGEVLCVIDPLGNAYAAYVVYGEETTDSRWHHRVVSVDLS